MKREISSFAIVKLAMVVAAASLLPLAANAQSGLRATFTLPCTAQWGEAVLPPGNYTLTFVQTADGAYDESIPKVTSANGKFGVFVPSPQMGDSVGHQDLLVLETIGNDCAVRSLNLVAVGTKYTYKVDRKWEEAHIQPGKRERQVALVMKKR